LEKSLKPNQKGDRKIKRKGQVGTQLQKRQHQTHLLDLERFSNELGRPYTEVGRQAGAVCEG
jgi:hypothetical protein